MTFFCKKINAVMKLKLLVFLLFCVFINATSPKPLVWVAIGDSITYLNDHPNETAHRITAGYMTQITKKAPHISYLNQGRNGWTAQHTAEVIEELDIPFGDVYSIFLGTNDWWRGVPVGNIKQYLQASGKDSFAGAYRIIINKIRALNPAAKIILITPMQRVDFVYIANAKNNAHGSYLPKNGQNLEEFAKIISNIGQEEHLPVVDLYHTKALRHSKLVHFKRLKDPATGLYKNYKYPDFVALPYLPEADEYPYPSQAVAMTYDGLHPSDAGYKIITKKLLKYLR
jgi:lysophospholipase L1-like esterase